MLAHLDLTSVRDLLANAMGYSSLMRVTSKPYSLALVCMIVTLFLSKVCEGGPEEVVTYPGFELFEGCVCRDVQAPVADLF